MIQKYSIRNSFKLIISLLLILVASTAPISAALYEPASVSPAPTSQVIVDPQQQILNDLFSDKLPVETNDTLILAMSSSNTSAIVARINNGRNQCAGLAAEYQADCLAQTFKSASAATRGKPDYAGPGRELSNASRKISSVVSANVDKSAPVIRKGGKKIRAVKKSSVAKVNKQVKAIIKETETKILRSAGSSAKRKTHFAQIAKAVGSTKTILRSA